MSDIRFIEFPKNITPLGTSFTTILPAAITESSPILTPFSTITLAPINTFLPMLTDLLL